VASKLFVHSWQFLSAFVAIPFSIRGIKIIRAFVAIHFSIRGNSFLVTYPIFITFEAVFIDLISIK